MLTGLLSENFKVKKTDGTYARKPYISLSVANGEYSLHIDADNIDEIISLLLESKKLFSDSNEMKTEGATK